MIGYSRPPGESGPLLKAMDIPALALAGFFAVLSILYPDTGTAQVFGRTLSRGYLVSASFFLSILSVLLLITLERRYGGRILCFLRTFYPQLLITFFFLESILLSTQVLGGRSHDAFFAALDQRIFGFQPYLVFYKAFESEPRFNELMFGSYFLYYVMIATVLWIPWIRGDREETERAVFIYFMITMLVSVWYVFFRVQGPKYWVPELREHWYGNFAGFFFVRFFQRGFETVNLSGAAFPSSHILFTTLFVIFGWRWDKRLLAVYLPMLALVLLATIYIFAHYVVDDLAGLVLAPILYFACSRLYEPFKTLFQPRNQAQSLRAATKA